MCRLDEGEMPVLFTFVLLKSMRESMTEFPECERSQAEGLKWTEIHCNWEQNVRREAEGGAGEAKREGQIYHHQTQHFIFLFVAGPYSVVSGSL